jgi:hypothetical protein
MRGVQQDVELEARDDVHPVEQMDEVLGGDVPGRTRREGTASDASDAGVDGGHPG